MTEAATAAESRSPLVRAAQECLGPSGPLSRTQAGFTERAAQQALAAEVAEAIDARGVLVAEAGTGTGKTFAYLVPAVLAHRRVLLSTGTKTLQDQLFQRDLPAVLGALGVDRRTALLKGRSNYVCRHHLKRNLAEGRFERRADIAVLQRIDRFAAITRSGDRAEAPGIPEDAPAWMHATSTRENCLGQECDFAEDCFVNRARRQAAQADLVVINHHLFCADLALRDEGVSELLPAVDVLVFDEAHQLPEVASQFLGRNVSSRQIAEFLRDAMRITSADARDAGVDWLGAAQGVERALADARLRLGERQRRIDDAALRATGFDEAFEAIVTLGEVLRAHVDAIVEHAERSRDLERMGLRGGALVSTLQQWCRGVRQASQGSDRAVRERDEEDDADDAVRWLEVQRGGFALQATPLSVADPFRRQIEGRPQAWIFTSATLSVGADFSHFTTMLGLDRARTARFDSPFDYASQSLLWVPADIGDPRAGEFAARLARAIAPLIIANGGRAFVLCTSLRMVDEMSAMLERLLPSSGESALVLMRQGDASRPLLLEQFRRAERPVLIGSASFWEGVDVVGAQLSLVVIDKLPFAPPDDPVEQARARALRRQGGDPFMQRSLPQAAMTLKQGAGRLIRSETDRGLLVIGDERLVQKAYGRRLLASLPPFPLTRDAADALAFVAAA